LDTPDGTGTQYRCLTLGCKVEVLVRRANACTEREILNQRRRAGPFMKNPKPHWNHHVAGVGLARSSAYGAAVAREILKKLTVARRIFDRVRCVAARR
jgi:hypothetical protein